MLTTAPVTRAKTGKQPKSRSADEQVVKMWYIHTGEHSSATKKNEVLIQGTAGLKPRIIILSGRGHT